MSALPDDQSFDFESPVFRAHEGGKLGVHATQPLRDRADLALLYTPGVAEVSLAIAADPALATRYTARGNTVAVVSDGTAVLGLGDIGPLGALPVMEGKAVLFKHFGGVDAVPVVMDSGTVDELVEAVARIAPTYGGINLEDISAPRCFDIEEQLKERLDIPVFHDDQHGTAIVVLAALYNALRVVEKDITKIRVVLSGAGAAGTAILKLLLAAGVGHVVVADIEGIVSKTRPGISGQLKWLADNTNPDNLECSLKEALAGADVFIGVSAPRVIDADDVATMADRAIVFALANPEPEIDPAEATRYAEVVATGRSDFPNQINNVLAFPGVFRGLLDARSTDITDGMLIAAARALASVVGDDELNATYITPSVFHADVHRRVAQAVRVAAGGPAELPTDTEVVA